MKLAVVQNKVYKNKNETIQAIKKQLDSIQESVDMIVFPEMFLMPYDNESFISMKETNQGVTIGFLRDVALAFDAYVVGGSMPFETNDGIVNRSYVLDNQGQILDYYDKIHLFEIEYPNGTVFRERDVLQSGDSLTVFDTAFGRFGLMICFDIRFPMLAQKYQELNIDMLLVPAAFNTFTGPMHWHTTFESRAIDNQFFVLGVSPSVNSQGQYSYYGHSVLYGPLGKKLFDLGQGESVRVFDVDFDEIMSARRQVPIVFNRREF
jgi:predicted amidohydrolase